MKRSLVPDEAPLFLLVGLFDRALHHGHYPCVKISAAPKLSLATFATIALLTTGCPDDEPGDESPSATTGGEDTSTGDDGTVAESTGDASTSGASSSGGAESSGDTTAMGTTDSESDSSSDSGGTESTTTTGDMADCVDEDLGSALGPSVLTGTTRGAGDDYDLDLCLLSSDEPAITTSGEDYVVSWTAPDNGLYIFSLEGSAFDTVIGVGPLMCDAMPVQCNDDCADAESATTYDAAAGQSLLIVIDGGAGAGGAFSLSVTEGTEECYDPQTSTDGG